MLRKMKNKTILKNLKSLLLPGLLLLCLLPSVWALFLSGFINTDDGAWMVIRFSAFYESLRDGQFPVRFLSRLNFGYGYPVANFLYPGFMYIATPIHILGFNFVQSIKIIIIFSMLGSGLFTYIWLSKLFNKLASFIGALFYVYIPYHLYDLYKRGSVGELLSLAWVPFSLLAIEKKNLILLSIAIFLLSISHNTLLLFFVPIIFIYGFIRKIKLQNLIGSFILGFGLASFFLLPAVFELGVTNFSNIQISNISEYFAEISLIGYGSFIVLFVALIIFLRQKKKDSLVAFFIAVSFISIFFATSPSSFLWQYLPAGLIQFPYRLLSFLVLSIAFLSAFIVNFSDKKTNKIISGVFVVVLILGAIQFIRPQKVDNFEDAFYSTNEATTTVKDEYMPKWVRKKPTKHFENKVEVVKGEGIIENLEYSPNRIKFSYSGDPGIVKVNTIYYPGWASNNVIDYNNEEGVMLFNVKNNSQVELVFGETAARNIANLISLVSFVVLIGLVVKAYKFKND